MKYDTLTTHLENLQTVVDTAGGELDVKDTYQRCQNKYMNNIQPNLYCLHGEEFKQAKQKMREVCFKKTEGLINVVLNEQAEKTTKT